MATNLEFIKSVDVTSATTNVDITNCFSDKYDVYKIVLSRLDISTNGHYYLRLFDSTGTIISASEYDNADLQLSADRAFIEHNNTNDTEFQYIASLGSATANSNGSVIYVFNPYDSSSYTFITWQSSGWTGALRAYKGIGLHKSAETITGVRFITKQTNGTENVSISVYGVK